MILFSLPSLQAGAMMVFFSSDRLPLARGRVWRLSIIDCF